MVESTELNKCPALWLSPKWSIHNQRWIEYEHGKKSWRGGSENVGCEIIVELFFGSYAYSTRNTVHSPSICRLLKKGSNPEAFSGLVSYTHSRIYHRYTGSL